MGAIRLGGKRPGGERLGGETTRGGNGLGAKRPGFIPSTSTSYTLPSHLTTIARGVCCIRKRENDRKVRSIVDRKPEKSVVLANAYSTLQSSTKLPSLRVPGHTKSPTA